MRIDPKDDTTWDDKIRQFVSSIQPWSGEVPNRLFHATAKGGFEAFDFQACHGCVWLQPDGATANEMALSFVGERGNNPAVYECVFTAKKLATIKDESMLFQLGHFFDHGRAEQLNAAAQALLTLGFDAIVDCCGNLSKPPSEFSYGALKPSAVRIVERHILRQRSLVRGRAHPVRNLCLSVARALRDSLRLILRWTRKLRV